MSSPHGQAVRSSKLEPVTVYHTTSIWFTHASLEGHRRRQRGILCGGDPPRGLSDETTSLGTMATAMERKPTPALQLLAPGRLLLGDSLQKGSKGVVQQGELQGFDYAPSYPTASSQGIGFHRRLRFQVALLPDPSGHTMLVRWLCSSPMSELLAQVGPLSFFPGLRKCTPRQPREHVNQQAASFQRPPKRPGGLAVTGLGKECTLTPSIRSESELLDLHFHRRPRPEFQDTAEG